MSLWYRLLPLVERQGLFLCQSAKVGLNIDVLHKALRAGTPCGLRCVHPYYHITVPRSGSSELLVPAATW